ncbi:MAG TPA: PEP-CTERM sorting domain-containing protein [Vicinamibacterales bacterium]|nr:PEP-CTERM sorting domain-containing protein [Vicinamibacterales bacterium]
MKSTKTLIAFFVAALAAAPARADAVLYSSFGPGDAYKDLVATYFGFDFGEEGDPDSRFARAMSFEPRTTASLTRIEMALWFPFSFSEGTLEINLFESDGSVPGAAIEHFDAAPDQAGSGIFRFDSVSHPTLLAGRTYFLEATTDGVADGLWFFSPNPVLELVPDVYRNLGGPWQQGLKDFNAAFRVSGVASDAEAAAHAPEPGSLVLLATGLGLTGWRARRRRQLAAARR